MERSETTSVKYYFIGSALVTIAAAFSIGFFWRGQSMAESFVSALLIAALNALIFGLYLLIGRRRP